MFPEHTMQVVRRQHGRSQAIAIPPSGRRFFPWASPMCRSGSRSPVWPPALP